MCDQEETIQRYAIMRFTRDVETMPILDKHGKFMRFSDHVAAREKDVAREKDAARIEQAERQRDELMEAESPLITKVAWLEATTVPVSAIEELIEEWMERAEALRAPLPSSKETGCPDAERLVPEMGRSWEPTKCPDCEDGTFWKPVYQAGNLKADGTLLQPDEIGYVSGDGEMLCECPTCRGTGHQTGRTERDEA